jgi:hypothetical protein
MKKIEHIKKNRKKQDYHQNLADSNRILTNFKFMEISKNVILYTDTFVLPGMITSCNLKK